MSVTPGTAPASAAANVTLHRGKVKGAATRVAAAIAAEKVATAPAPALATAPPRPVNLQDVQSALKAPGLVTVAPLTYNQLIIELAKSLQTQVDDGVFIYHKSTIIANYVNIYNDVVYKASTGASLASESAPRITFTLSNTSMKSTNIDETSGRPKRAAAANVTYSAFMNIDDR